MSPRARFARLVGVMLVVGSGAACGAGSLPATPAAQPAATASPAPPTPAATALAATTPAPRPSRPPAASLEGLVGGALTGDEGSFSWDGLSSDSPWIVGPSAGTAHPGTRLRVRFASDAGQVSWQARWAPVVGGGAGTPFDAGSGLGGTIELTPSGTPGTWSLQLTASFGAGRNATWYWRIEVVR